MYVFMYNVMLDYVYVCVDILTFCESKRYTLSEIRQDKIRPDEIRWGKVRYSFVYDQCEVV